MNITRIQFMNEIYSITENFISDELNMSPLMRSCNDLKAPFKKTLPALCCFPYKFSSLIFWSVPVCVQSHMKRRSKCRKSVSF